MTLSEFKNSASARLSVLYDEREASSIVSILLQERLGLPAYKILAEPDMDIRADIGDGLPADLSQLAEGRPLQYVLGVQEFCGHRFKVSEGCLIPRPETEELVMKIAESVGRDDREGDAAFNILDMCTGSGCIAWSLAAGFPGAQVFACDNSDAALRIACRQRVKVQGAKPVFFQCDVLQAPPAGLPKFDLIVSNPPYIAESEKSRMRRNVLDYEPSEALFVPDDDALRFYEAIRRWGDALLADGGEIWCEINERFGPATASVFGPDAEVLQDISGKDRFVHFKK